MSDRPWFLGMGEDLRVRGERPSHAHGRCSLFAGPLGDLWWGDSGPPRTERFCGNGELRAELAWVWGQRWRGFVPALCCDPGPLRASMRICRPLALDLQVRATRSGIEALSPGWKEGKYHRLRGSEPAVLPPTSAVGDVPQGLERMGLRCA